MQREAAQRMVKKKSSEGRFSLHEYDSLRQELITRMMLINNQASTAIVTFISAWAAGITLLVLLAGEDIEKPIFSIALGYISSISFLLPVFFFVPLAIKSGENIQQIASISAYIRVFFDYLNLHRQDNRTNWEISNNLQSNVNVDRGKKSREMRLYNGEYTILSIFSLFVYFVSIIPNIQTIVALQLDWCRMILVIVPYPLLAVGGVCAIWQIHKVSSMKHAMMDSTVKYVEGFLKRAIDLNLINIEDFETAKDFLNPMKENEE